MTNETPTSKTLEVIAAGAAIASGVAIATGASIASTPALMVGAGAGAVAIAANLVSRATLSGQVKVKHRTTSASGI
jgi:hypothetical protein